ncbi:MAG: response regulator [Nitrososphaeraceae archaeon]|nr:response regulator [Nitrososphaeraceae archaeon]
MLNRLASYSDTEKKTVMICDDERDLLKLFGKALQTKYNVILVGSDEDCIEKFIDEESRGNKIHLILLDYRLGGMFGDSVARKIKEYNGTKIILISAYDLDGELVKDLEENKYIAKYIEKPIFINSLIELVADTIS